MHASTAYLVFAVLGVAGFLVWRPPVASLAAFLGGWLLLPVGLYPADATASAFPYWIVGLALPSDMLLTKAWVAPVVALAGAAIFDRAALRRLRPVPLDGLMALWCAWPLVHLVLEGAAEPPPPIASLYLAGSWGAPWVLGRLYFTEAAGARTLLCGLAAAALACLPFSLLEAVRGPVFYALLYEPHPFRIDGQQRYLGFRPLGFFEHGNQFGLWVAMGALAAVWLAASDAGRRQARWLVPLAALCVAMTLAAQSVGAILLLAAGAGLMCVLRPARLARATLATMLALVAAAAVYLSGAVPLRHIATETGSGRALVAAIDRTGRGSFTWRVSQDERLLRPALARPIEGSGRWDWWRTDRRRPWGIALLLAGQFGLVGLASAFGALLGSAAWAASRNGARRTWEAEAAPAVLALIVFCAAADALLNSFIYFPAVLAAGALAAAKRSPEPREPARA